MTASPSAVHLWSSAESATGKVLLKGPVHEARATIFDYDSWLETTDLPIAFLHKETTDLPIAFLLTFAKHSSSQFIKEFGEGWFDDLLSEWRQVVQLVVGEIQNQVGYLGGRGNPNGM